MPGLLSSPGSLTVIWFLSWQLCFSGAQIWTNEVSNVQYGHLDSNVTLACGKSQIKRIPVVWHLNGSRALPWHGVTSDGSLVLLHVNLSAQGNYSCYDNQGLLLHSIKLRLGFPPGRLNISCQVPNHSHVRCSWNETVKSFLPVKYNASFRGVGHKWQTCVVNASHNYCDVEDPPFWDRIHTLNITASNALGSKTTDARFKLEALLKPDPPESVIVNEVEGYPERLNVSWNFPSSWPVRLGFSLIFQIRYKPFESQIWSEFNSEESPAMIWDALAGHLHQVQVRARDEVNSETQWSDWSPLLYGRPWEDTATSKPPEDNFPDYIFHFQTKPETSTSRSHKPVPPDDGNLGLVILLVLFAVVIIATVLSLIFVVWVKQRRREHVTKQELTSMVKMKSMPV
ncbi:interleukin-11 receptor subunit alpha [Corythoichthys intestinalis]|uniref:interleukin-11 receptor subunit alpha n=1 Tax=Corythoichthys intestinalis TaxID=161448 RepID=UPI0025A5142E|nr:interleukin-11 receptor subunit alpha [Corythoichthys intestinalis]XP_061800018.1 interleukin-11 receptor subunit alpha-1-like [Nerophis lumbriciformis]